MMMKIHTSDEYHSEMLLLIGSVAVFLSEVAEHDAQCTWVGNWPEDDISLSLEWAFLYHKRVLRVGMEKHLVDK